MTVSCRDIMLKDVGKPDCWSALKTMGISAIEVALDDDLRCYNLFHPAHQYSIATPEDVKRLQDDLAAHGVTITAVGFFYRGSEWRLKRDVALARRVVPIIDSMGIKVLRVDMQARRMSAEEFLPVAIEAGRDHCRTAEGTRVVIGVENHSMNTNDPAFLERLLDGVGSPKLKMTLDPNNFYWFGWPLSRVYDYYKKFAPRVVHTHCKNVRYPITMREVRRQPDRDYMAHSAPIYDGDVDYRRVAEILHKANYRGDLCLENECLHHFAAAEHLGVIRKEIALLKSLA